MSAARIHHAEKGNNSGAVMFHPMTKKDVIPFCNLFQHVFAQEPWNEKWKIEQIRTFISRHMRKRGFFGITATISHHTIGYLTGFCLRLIPSLFYMDQLFIDTDYHGLKIGKKLIIEAENNLKNKGITCIFLLTKSKSHAEQFYIKNNYTSFLHAFRIKGKLLYFKYLGPKNTGV